MLKLICIKSSLFIKLAHECTLIKALMQNYRKNELIA